jgi:hypothetical protein
MQVNYSSTVEKLTKYQEKIPTIRPEIIPDVKDTLRSKYSNQTIISEKEFKESMRNSLKKETFINERKRLYNKEVSRQSIAHQILQGTAPMPKHVLYPLKATHDQILAMTGARTAPDANKIPAAVPKPKRWLGDGIGWET